MIAKQKKQLVLLVVLLVVAIGSYFGLRFANSKTSDEEIDDDSKIAVTTLTADQVTSLAYTNDSGTVKLQKEGDDWVTPDDPTLDLEESSVQLLVSDIAELKSNDEITDVTDLSIYGLDQPVQTITISDGTTTETVYVGDLNSTVSKYYIYLDGKQDVVYTASSTLTDAFSKTIDDLLVETDTTEAQTESTDN